MKEAIVDGRYSTANMPVFLLRCLAATLADLGISPDRLCVGLGFSPSDLADPACRVSFRQGSMMIRRALKMAKGRGLGLDIGERETIASIGLVGYAMITCATFGEAIALGIKQQKFTGNMLDFDFEIRDGKVVISASSRFHEPDIHAFLVEEAFASFLQIARSLTGPAFRPIRVDFAYPAPDYQADYDRVFGCDIRFGQTVNEMHADVAWIGKPLMTHDPLSHRQALEFLEISATRERETVELVESVERMLRQNLNELPGLADIAGKLCLSERTLRRRLANCGVSFQALLDNLRKNRALELLGNPNMSIEQVAFAVGFSDPHNFRRAFRRWTGSSPSKMRSAATEIWPQ